MHRAIITPKENAMLVLIFLHMQYQWPEMWFAHSIHHPMRQRYAKSCLSNAHPASNSPICLSLFVIGITAERPKSLSRHKRLVFHLSAPNSRC
jgi:hypothetical protein